RRDHEPGQRARRRRRRPRRSLSRRLRHRPLAADRRLGQWPPRRADEPLRLDHLDRWGILGYVASEMILSDRSLARVIEHVAPGRALLPFLPAVGIVALGWWFSAKNGRKGVPGRA